MERVPGGDRGDDRAAHITGKGEITCLACNKLVCAIGKVYLFTSDEYLRLLGRIYSRHYNLCGELIASYYCLGIRDNESRKFVYADILNVDIAYEIVKNLTLGISDTPYATCSGFRR